MTDDDDIDLTRGVEDVDMGLLDGCRRPAS